MSSPDPNRRPSSAGRYLFMLLLGLFLGVLGTVMLMRSWESRKTSQDLMPDALMNVQQWHLDKLGEGIKANRCNATDVLPHLQALRMTSSDIDAAFPGLAEDQGFSAASAAMRATMDKVVASPPLTCEGLGASIKSIGESCKGCHQDFRN